MAPLGSIALCPVAIQTTGDSAQCTVNSAQYTVHSVQCTVYCALCKALIHGPSLCLRLDSTKKQFSVITKCKKPREDTLARIMMVTMGYLLLYLNLQLTVSHYHNWHNMGMILLIKIPGNQKYAVFKGALSSQAMSGPVEPPAPTVLRIKKSFLTVLPFYLCNTGSSEKKFL